MNKEAKRCFQQSSWCARRFLFNERNIASFDAKLPAELTPGKACLLAKLRYSFTQIQQLASDCVVRIAHVSLVENLKMVFHR